MADDLTVEQALPEEEGVYEEVDHTVDKAGTVRAALEGYSGGVAIARELIQNADDARATRITFDFRPDELFVTNDQVFTPKDFESILLIGAGGKRFDADKTGTFGVGFVSVFMLTDEPQVRSADRRLKLHPVNSRVGQFLNLPYLHGTEITLPYRRTPTEAGRKIQSEPVDDAYLSAFQSELERELDRLLIFLRNVREIELRRSGTTFARAVRKAENLPTAASHQLRGASLAAFSLETTRQEVTEYQRWLLVTGSVPNPPLGPDGKPTKSDSVSVAFRFPEDGAPSPGHLYNTLPTAIQTGFKFHINGDFFPSYERKSINLDTPDRKVWNLEVLRAAARLVTLATPVLKALAPNPSYLWDLLPFGHRPDYRFLDDFTGIFTSFAQEYDLVWTVEGKWVRPQEAWIASSEELQNILGGYRPGLVAPELRAETSIIQKLKIPKLYPQDLKSFVDQHVRPGLLENAHPVANTPEKVTAILVFLLEHYTKPKLLHGLPLCLDARSSLHSLGTACFV
ncbi:MAG TPA: hypothetical protein VD902_00520, partial [Symbiobacteriaceae bacterium]|nr:hypothetical protein [Symbiobacteriaceae bacterium]